LRTGDGDAKGLAVESICATGRRSLGGKGGGPSGREAAGRSAGAKGLTIVEASAASHRSWEDKGGLSGCEAAAGAEGLTIAAASAAGDRSLGGKGGGPSGREAAAGAEGLTIAAVSAAGHRSRGGKGGGCDIDIVRDLRTGVGDAKERIGGTAGVAGW
jgi:hypothetical protein